MPAIPDRWIPYKACGNVIEGTRFICFKVPLRKSVQSGIQEIKEIWDIPSLLKKIPNLGAVIDLTNTARYYNPEELLAAGVLHKKILMPGRIIPPENKVTEFTEAVDEFLDKDDDFLIGVHCTHGLNRTGYMVCRYMRDKLGLPAKDAIKKFEKARGYQIERANYIADLLGEIPPDADVGSFTEVKPVSKDDDLNRSPLTDEEDEDEASRDRYIRSNNRPNDRYNKYDSKNRRYNGNRSYDNNGRDRERSRENWRDRDNNRSNRQDGGSNRSNWQDRGNNRSNWRERESRESNYRRRENSRRQNYKRSKSSSSSDSSRSSYDFRYDY